MATGTQLEGLLKNNKGSPFRMILLLLMKGKRKLIKLWRQMGAFFKGSGAARVARSGLGLG